MRYSERGKLLLQREWVRPLRDEILSTMTFESVPLVNLAPPDDTFTVIAVQDRYGFPVRLGLSHSTGLIYAIDRLTQADYYRFYQESYYRRLVTQFFQGGDAPYGDERLHSQDDRSRENALLIARVLKGLMSLPHGATMLDIGGSTGALAQTLGSQYNLHATVVDPSESELKLAAAKGLDTRHGLFEQVAFAPDEQFDLITLNQTIEHIYDLRLTFAKIRDLLKPDGYFVFDIVDFLTEVEMLGTSESVARLDHCYFLYNEMIDVFCGLVGLQVIQTIHYKNVSILYICRRLPTPVNTVVFSNEKREAVVRSLLNKSITWQKTPRILDYSLTERIERGLRFVNPLNRRK